VLKFYRTERMNVDWEWIGDRLVAYCSDQVGDTSGHALVTRTFATNMGDTFTDSFKYEESVHRFGHPLPAASVG
jgi:hypothetical protein